MRVRSWGGISALNAIISGYGSSMAISLPVDVTVEFSDENEIMAIDRQVVEEIMRLIEIKRNLRIVVNSQIPVGAGLKSSSAVTSAVALAIIGLLRGKFDVDEAVRISAAASIKLNISVTGAYDDSYASLLGGLVITSNYEGKLLGRYNVPADLEVIVGIPSNTKKAINVEGLRSMKPIGVELSKMIESGKWAQAMTINGLLVASANGYDPSPIIGAVKEGAIAAGISGNGPAYFCLVNPGAKLPGSFNGLKVIRASPKNSGYEILK